MLKLNKIYLGDCLNYLKLLPDKYIDLVLTDPPYGKNIRNGNNYGISTKKMKTLPWDKNTTQTIYFDEIFRVSKNQIIFGGNYFNLPVSNCWLVWDKIGNFEFNNPYADCELAWTSFNKVVKKYTFIQQGFIKCDKASRIHPAQKPLQLFKNILGDFAKAGYVILDCFSGSGTTAIACHDLGLDFICIEKNFDYWLSSTKRYEEHISQMRLIYV